MSQLETVDMLRNKKIAWSESHWSLARRRVDVKSTLHRQCLQSFSTRV